MSSSVPPKPERSTGGSPPGIPPNPSAKTSNQNDPREPRGLRLETDIHKTMTAGEPSLKDIGR